MNKLLLQAITNAYALGFTTVAMAVVPAQQQEQFDGNAHQNRGMIYKINDHPDSLDAHGAEKLAEEGGYKILSGIEKKSDIFVMLGEKGGFYSELHITKDRKIYVERTVGRNDPEWQSKIKR
ncbi:hypothetical protein [Methylobacterium sp. ap11]|uniref:hypothetical protein n=1 Tax=Methylobacterium sp. ap11 TaxID=1761799 RepID=UPI0011608A63|nr:hypothetical protein [Methylobacterium sp. ap11]